VNSELALLRDQFPDYDLTVEVGRGRFRYISRSWHFGQKPHTVVTSEPDELRNVLQRVRAAESASDVARCLARVRQEGLDVAEELRRPLVSDARKRRIRVALGRASAGMA